MSMTEAGISAKAESKNPWARGDYQFNGRKCQTEVSDAHSRYEIVREAPPEKLRQIIAWPGTQASVRKKAEARLRGLARRGH